MPIQIKANANAERTVVTNTLTVQLQQWCKTLTAKHISARERMFFTEQLALLLETGTNLREALQILQQQSDNPTMVNLIGALLQQINEGKPFSYALSLHPHVFDTSYTSLIAASERGGFIHRVLQELLAMDEKRERLNTTVISALSYPAFLVFFSLIVVVFVLVVVFPKFAVMFESIYDQLPVTTKALMWVSDMFVDYWPWLLAATAVIVVLLRQWLCSIRGRVVVDTAKLSVPVIKHIFVELYLVQSLRLMGQSLASGVPITQTLAACREVVSNQRYQAFVRRVESNVQEGSGIAVAFEREKFIPSMVYQMIATGEATGSLPLVMAKVADYYERRLQRRLTTLSKVAEPLMLVVMGAVVGILVSSLMLPIFSLSKAVH